MTSERHEGQQGDTPRHDPRDGAAAWRRSGHRLAAERGRARIRAPSKGWPTMT